jgi:hypothetical protein
VASISYTKKWKGKKRNTPSKEITVGEKEPHASKAMQGKKKAKPQGEQSIPEATDTHGCKHKGLMELKMLPSRPPVYFSWLCGNVSLCEASGSIPDMRLCFTIH